MSDVLGSIWEDTEVLVGKGRYFLVVKVEPAPNNTPGEVVVETYDLDRETPSTMQLTFDTRYEAFPFLESLRRLM